MVSAFLNFQANVIADQFGGCRSVLSGWQCSRSVMLPHKALPKRNFERPTATKRPMRYGVITRKEINSKLGYTIKEQQFHSDYCLIIQSSEKNTGRRRCTHVFSFLKPLRYEHTDKKRTISLYRLPSAHRHSVAWKNSQRINETSSLFHALVLDGHDNSCTAPNPSSQDVIGRNFCPHSRRAFQMSKSESLLFYWFLCICWQRSPAVSNRPKGRPFLFRNKFVSILIEPLVCLF